MKHFEDVWNEAEKVSTQRFESEYDQNSAAPQLECIVSNIAKEMEEDEPNIAPYVGEALVYLAFLCNKMNINSWKEMEAAVNDMKIELNDLGEELCPDN